ncbi:peptidase domain protein [Beutenbergia cavernae DSM 12333]|uniref:Peptidase domain protein n=1 Tax=Beutenbergia cavernae (strain ATCC BAA-8 / DSM 12333 / CCUG 43141 / JCM 11478 / NBRC 16432 / NCIMB 13614 / HKI 0122) TaxID=471853 RepID=C5C2L5_BEUC1|nr:DUF2510 domain-containing protein [Beutenbergia cavernae]ACQ79701.1 peptidase domain protein [Beutenbergia cavernae DSM 12333]
MSTPPAGWFPDPDGQDRLRYWDGTAWTEHYAASNEPPGAPSGPAAPGGYDAGYGTAPTTDFGAAPGYGQSASGGYGQAPSGGYGQSASGGYGQAPSGGYGQAPSGGYGAAPAPGWADTAGTAYGVGGQQQPGQQYDAYGQPQGAAAYGGPGGPGGPGPGGSGGNRGLVIALIAIGAVVVIVLAVLGIRLLTAGGDPTTLPTQQPTVQPTSDPTDPPTTGGGNATGELPLDSPVEVSVPAGATFEATFTIPEDGLYVIAAEGQDDADTTLALLDSSGSEIAAIDDHPSAARNLFNSTYDSLLTGYYAAGDYTVVVAEYYGDAADVTLSATHVAEAVEIPTQSAQFSVPEGSAWFGWVTIADGESVTLDARATTDDGDLRMSLVAPDGDDVLDNDDRGSDADTQGGDSYDPLIVASDLPAGRYVVVISDYNGAAADATIVATHE